MVGVIKFKVESLKLKVMRETTKKRYARIRQAAGELYGTLPVMKIYLELGERFGLSDEWIRHILSGKNTKKHPP